MSDVSQLISLSLSLSSHFLFYFLYFFLRVSAALSSCQLKQIALSQTTRAQGRCHSVFGAQKLIMLGHKVNTNQNNTLFIFLLLLFLTCMQCSCSKLTEQSFIPWFIHPVWIQLFGVLYISQPFTLSTEYGITFAVFVQFILCDGFAVKIFNEGFASCGLLKGRTSLASLYI